MKDSEEFLSAQIFLFQSISVAVHRQLLIPPEFFCLLNLRIFSWKILRSLWMPKLYALAWQFELWDLWPFQSIQHDGPGLPHVWKPTTSQVHSQTAQLMYWQISLQKLATHLARSCCHDSCRSHGKLHRWTHLWVVHGCGIPQRTWSAICAVPWDLNKTSFICCWRWNDP